MTVAELIERLSKFPPTLEVGTGYPAVWQGQENEYQESLCRIDDVKAVNLSWDTWLGRNFVLLEIVPEVVISHSGERRSRSKPSEAA